MGLWARLTSADALHEAWLDVRAAAATQEGKLPGGLRHYERQLERNLEHLRLSLEEGWYRPRDLAVHRIPKEDGSSRILHVPPLDDRVVERAFLNELNPLVDPVLSDAAHAYRPGRGVHSAVRDVVGLRTAGLLWVARGDVDECFPSISVESVLDALGPFGLPDAMHRVIVMFLARRARIRRPTEVLRGLPQGSPLSPLFMNLVLTPFDEGLMNRGCPLVRYADDFVIAGGDEGSVRRWLERSRQVLTGLGLRLGEEKTEVTTFDLGFSFLGEEFGPKLPAPAPEEVDLAAPRSLYVGLQGARISAERGRVIVRSADEAELLSLPQGRVGRIVTAGSVAVSAGARTWALMNDVPTVFLSRSGNFLGSLLPESSAGQRRRIRAQLAFTDRPAARLGAARVIVSGKIRKQRVVLQRAARGMGGDATGALATMKSTLEGIPTAADTEELMGLEGAAAAAYFAALGALMPDGLRFTSRSRRPPLDLFNAAISYGYAILYGEAVAALHAAGLEPGFGLLHSDASGRESLALDLMEEFRPWVVDRAVTALVAARQLRSEHGTKRENVDGVLLTAEGKDVLVKAYETRMLAPANKSLPGLQGSVRRCLHRQAQRLALHMSDPDESPFTECAWR